MHPLERFLLVEQSHVLRVGIVLAVRQVRQMQEAHHTQSVRNGDNDDIGMLLEERNAIKHRVDGSARLKSTAVNPYHDRFTGGGVVGLKDVQVEAVLVPVIHRTDFKRRIAVGALGIVIGLIDAVVGYDIYGRFPA